MTVATIIVCSTAIFAQKAGVNRCKKQILSDREPIALFQKEGCGVFSPTCVYYIHNLDNELLITISMQCFTDRSRITLDNPDGKRVCYLRFAFMGFDETAEIAYPAILTLKPKHIAKSIVKARLIVDGRLDEKAVRQFINLNGNRFTDMQQELTQPQQVIIIDR